MMKSQSVLINSLLSIALFCASFYLAWQLCTSISFSYSSWYEVLDLGDAIARYAPDNKFKKGFENTSKQQHVELFAGIVYGIQHKGKGLKNLAYLDLKTKIVSTFLTDAEMVHLQDVANLVGKFKYVGIGGLIIAVVVFLFMRARKIAIVKFRSHLFGGIGTIIVLAIFTMLIGPTKIFYLGHELIFPNNHQWFFYYEDSLMSTIMKAPVLFGPIVFQLLVLTVLFWMLSIYILQKIYENKNS